MERRIALIALVLIPNFMANAALKLLDLGVEAVPVPEVVETELVDVVTGLVFVVP